MPLSLSKKSALIIQSEIRTITSTCAKIGGINLSDSVLPGKIRRWMRHVGDLRTVAKKMKDC